MISFPLFLHLTHLSTLVYIFHIKQSEMKKHNFSAGPAILPQEVFAQAASAIRDFEGMGLSILEISHRSKEFTAVMEEAQALVLELANLDADDYAVLFLGGGASSQFFMVPMNLMDEGQSAAYINTGAWATKAIKEAKLFGHVSVVASSEDDAFTYIPKGWSVPTDARYVHITTNNTIRGTQYHALPDTGDAPLVADMSSDIFSRPLDFSRFGLFYAGAQKNLGPAGVTLVVVRKDLVGQVRRQLPTMLNYQTHIDKGSMFNTPPVFPIYTLMLTLRWIKSQGGLTAMEVRNREKATLFYSELDRNPLFRGTAVAEDRSWMNATFVLERPELEQAFLQACEAAGCVGLKGHRSVGGFRASMYNAMELESVQTLVDVMRDFAEKHA